MGGYPLIPDTVPTFRLFSRRRAVEGPEPLLVGEEAVPGPLLAPHIEGFGAGGNSSSEPVGGTLA